MTVVWIIGVKGFWLLSQVHMKWNKETANLQGEPHGVSKVLGTLKIGDKFFAVAVLGAEYPINPLDRLAPQECGDDRCGIWYERKVEDQKTGEMRKTYVGGDKLVRVE